MSPVTAKKYYNLKEIDIPDEEKPKNYSSKISKINGYRNMVYKMLKDGINPVIIKEYVKYIDNVERDISYRKVNIHHDKKGQYFIYYRKKYYLKDF